MVRLEHIGKRYGDGVQVLDDVSLTLEPGGFTFVTGASGSGKTTLLKLITLAEPPSGGRMTLFGTDIATLDRAGRAAMRRRIGIVFQDLRLIDDLSAYDNVALPLRICGVGKPEIGANVPELLRWVGLAGRGDAKVGDLSGGERQRVAVARAVIRRPELLVADEPTGSVDDDTATLLVRVFERLNRLGATVLVATHDIDFADRFAHRRLHLERGELSAGDDAAAL